jgi:acyl-CoA-dependent ceramide synthase
VFLHVAEDDRSDNDEKELEEEQRLDALARHGIDKVAGPKMLLNGELVTENGHATGTEIRTNGMTNRKENVRKA